MRRKYSLRDFAAKFAIVATDHPEVSRRNFVSKAKKEGFLENKAGRAYDRLRKQQLEREENEARRKIFALARRKKQGTVIEQTIATA